MFVVTFIDSRPRFMRNEFFGFLCNLFQMRCTVLILIVLLVFINDWTTKLGCVLLRSILYLARTYGFLDINRSKNYLVFCDYYWNSECSFESYFSIDSSNDTNLIWEWVGLFCVFAFANMKIAGSSVIFLWFQKVFLFSARIIWPGRDFNHV